MYRIVITIITVIIIDTTGYEDRQTNLSFENALREGETERGKYFCVIL